MIYVIGSTGLVGSAICDYFEKIGTDYIGINRGNYQKYMGTTADVLVNANGSGFKGRANEDPKTDFGNNVQSTVNLAFDFKFKTFIHVSSVDVYPQPYSIKATSEDVAIDPMTLHPYGFHKYLSELIVRRYCPNWVILRLGGLVGKKLKKNPIYDWTHDKPLLISAKSELTFIHTDIVAEIVNLLIAKDVDKEIINVCSSDSVRLQDLDSVSGFKIRESLMQAGLAVQKYHINGDKLRRFFPVKTSREYIGKYLRENL